MKRKQLVSLLAFIALLAPAVVADVAETFENDTLGVGPTSNWYNYTGTGVVVTPGLDSTNQAVQVTRSGINQYDFIDFIDYEYDAISFYAEVSDPDSCTINVVRASDNGQMTILSVDTPGDPYWFVNPGNTQVAPDFATHHFRLEMNYTTNSVSYYVDFSPVAAATKAFINDGVPGALRMGAFNGDCVMKVDELYLESDFFVDPEIAPPTGLTGRVDAVGTVSTSGKVVLRWSLSDDDPNRDAGEYTYTVYEDGSPLTVDTIDSSDGGGIRQYTHRPTGAGPHGIHNYTVTAKSTLESNESCSITLDLDTLNDSDQCGDPVVGTGRGAEFDTGLIGAIESFGFVSVESKKLFNLILVGIAQVTAAASSKMLSSGRFKNYLIFGTGAIVGVFTLLIGFLELWEWLVAFMLGLFAVRGVQEIRNTYLEILQRAQGDNEPVLLDDDEAEAFNLVASAPGVGPDVEDTDVDDPGESLDIVDNNAHDDDVA